MTVPQQEKRATKRRLIGLLSECRKGGLFAETIVRDLTQVGAFVASSLRPGSADSQSSTSEKLEQLLQVGDEFLLVYLKSPFMHERSMNSIVRWSGFSSEHGCHGFGVEFCAD